MAATIINCCCRLGPPPAPPKQAAAGVSVTSHALRRACVAAAACAVIGMVGGGAAAADTALSLARDGAVVVSKTDAVPVGGATRVKAPRRWSDRRQCPPWRANSLENVVPENLPRASAHRRFGSFSVSAAEGAATAPDLVAPPSFLALPLRPGMGCFSL